MVMIDDEVGKYMYTMPIGWTGLGFVFWGVESVFSSFLSFFLGLGPFWGARRVCFSF